MTSNRQSPEDQGTYIQIHTHIHIPHTLLKPQSLIYCCHGNPIKGGQSSNNSGKISLPLFYLTLACSFTHILTCSFSSPASHFYLSPSITFSSSPSVFLLLFLHHPGHISLSVSLHYHVAFQPPFSGKCKYVSLPLKHLQCLCVIFAWSSFTHSKDTAVCLFFIDSLCQTIL